eukprot:5609848-Amphidinium_carterae.1
MPTCKSRGRYEGPRVRVQLQPNPTVGNRCSGTALNQGGLHVIAMPSIKRTQMQQAPTTMREGRCNMYGWR